MAVSNGAGEGPNDLEKKIIRQIEYYFGDMNLPRDKFLQEKIKEDDGWVSLDIMLNFNRLKTISDDKEIIAKAMKKSTSGLVEVNDDSAKIRRCPNKPLPDNTKERKDDINARSVYAKGFQTDSTLDSLQTFFEQFGKIDSIFMRRLKDKTTFKGSVFVTFANLDEAKKFVEKESVQHGDTEIVKLLREDYFKKKTIELKEKKKRTASTSIEDQKKAEDKKADDERKLDEQMTRGAVIFMKGLKTETNIDDVRNYFEEFGKVAWVEYAKGDEKALVRFQEAEAESVLEKARTAGDGKIVICGAELETHVLEGEEEKEYWRKMFSDIADKIMRIKSKRQQKGKRKFSGRSGKRGNRDYDDFKEKKPKLSDDAE